MKVFHRIDLDQKKLLSPETSSKLSILCINNKFEKHQKINKRILKSFKDLSFNSNFFDPSPSDETQKCNQILTLVINLNSSLSYFIPRPFSSDMKIS